MTAVDDATVEWMADSRRIGILNNNLYDCPITNSCGRFQERMRGN